MPKQYAIAYGRVKLAGPDTRGVGGVGAFFGKFQETKNGEESGSKYVFIVHEIRQQWLPSFLLSRCDSM